jgi:hypothetical protein
MRTAKFWRLVVSVGLTIFVQVAGAVWAQESQDDSPEARRERYFAAPHEAPQKHSFPANSSVSSSTTAPPNHTLEEFDLARGDPFLKCLLDTSDEAEFSRLARKLPLVDPTHITFSMLANDALPTPAERRRISDWFDKRQQCWKDNEGFHRTQWRPEIFQLATEGNDGMQAIGVDLYNLKISYGQANKRIQQLGNAITERMMAVFKQYQAEAAAQKEAADEAAERQRAEAARLAVEEDRRQEVAEARAAQERAYAAAQTAQQQLLRQQRALLLQNALRVATTACTGDANGANSANAHHELLHVWT